MVGKNKKKQKISDLAKKKRHLHLLDKLHTGKILSTKEIKELEAIDGSGDTTTIAKSQSELAEALGVSRRTITRLVSLGMPVMPSGYYDVEKIKAWNAARELSSVSDDITNWDLEYRKHKALLAEMEWKQKSGELVPVEDVELEITREFVGIKRRLLMFPRVVAPQVVGLDVVDVERIIRERLEEIIGDFANGQFTKKRKTKRRHKR